MVITYLQRWFYLFLLFSLYSFTAQLKINFVVTLKIYNNSVFLSILLSHLFEDLWGTMIKLEILYRRL